MPLQSQIINGVGVTPYSPQWYKAMEQDTIHRADVGGTAEGTGEAAYLSKLGPSLAGLYSAMGMNTAGGSGSSVAPATVGYPTSSSSSSSTPSVATIAPVDFSKANAAAFATAKDQAAKTAQASLTGLDQALAARGLRGGGFEAGTVGRTLGREANQIGAAANAEAAHEADLNAQAAGENLSAEVTQRGQDIGAAEAERNREAEALASQYSGAIAQRGQDIGLSENAADLAQRTAALRSQQTLEILRSVLMGGRGGVPPNYVY